MSKPIRIQRQRTKGWTKPDNTVNVARPSKWGNPFVTGQLAPQWALKPMGLEGKGMTKIIPVRDNAQAAYLFRGFVDCQPELKAQIRTELKDKNLMCWCKVGEPCHGDVLLELANSEDQ